MLKRFFIFIILNLSFVLVHAAQSKSAHQIKPNVIAKTSKLSRDEEEAAEDTIFKQAIKQKARVLYTRAGAKFQSFKEDKNHNPHAGNNLCAHQ